MHTDPIADLLTRIRNAQLARKESVEVPFSKIKLALVKLLMKEGYLAKVEVVPAARKARRRNKQKNNQFDRIKIKLMYRPDGSPRIERVFRVSKPGRRVYSRKNELPIVREGLGLAVISTSQGLMTNKEARDKGLGGEIICEVY